jgi:hypothetical protein
MKVPKEIASVSVKETISLMKFFLSLKGLLIEECIASTNMIYRGSIKKLNHVYLHIKQLHV